MTEGHPIPLWRVRNLVLVLGDQLNRHSAAFRGFDRKRDAVLLIESPHEATYMPQHKIRLLLFFSAMRHFRDELRNAGIRVYYRELDDARNAGQLETELSNWRQQLQPSRVIVLEPGDYRVHMALSDIADRCKFPLEIREDDSFLCSRSEFQEYAGRRDKLVLEDFYRVMRRRHGILRGKHPLDGGWNADARTTAGLPKSLRTSIPPLHTSAMDATTAEVKTLIERMFPHTPGSMEAFDYPVTREQALLALKEFIQFRLANFGHYQEAMLQQEPYLFHSRLSASLNLHLLDAREVLRAATEAYDNSLVPLNAIEGFARQILGWREYVRGMYWLHMPNYAHRNALAATKLVPRFMWTGATDMNCVRSSVAKLNQHAYTHHSERLMVLGLYCLLLGVDPYRFHLWHMSMYADAIDWASLPNALGVSQFGDGGILVTKPFCASGHYIERTSDFCASCRYQPRLAHGADACPFTTLYWDFLARHRSLLERNGNMIHQMANLRRQEHQTLLQIRRQAERLREATE